MNKEAIAIKDTQSFMYQLTINAPEEKGWTHEHILEVMRGNFKTLILTNTNTRNFNNR